MEATNFEIDRIKNIDEITKKRQEIEQKEIDEKRKNSGFTQTYQKGWEKIRELIKGGNPGSVQLYTFLAENIDQNCGAVVADQSFLAEKLNVSRSTIVRWLNYLEEKNALIRIPVAGKVCAYALDPHEVWKGYNTTKPYAAFITKTLVNQDEGIKRKIMSMFKAKEKENAEMLLAGEEGLVAPVDDQNHFG